MRQRKVRMTKEMKQKELEKLIGKFPSTKVVLGLMKNNKPKDVEKALRKAFGDRIFNQKSMLWGNMTGPELIKHLKKLRGR